MSSNDPEHRLPAMMATIAGMREILSIQTRHIDACLHLLNEDECGRAPLPSGEPDINRVIKALMHMIGISAHSLLKLTDEVGLGAKDGYPLARAIIEGAVNIAYLMANDPEVSRKAQRHAEVRAFRDLSRQEVIGGWTINAGYRGLIPSDEVKRLEAMAAEFTTTKGREKDWTDLSVRQRLDAAALVFKSTALLSLNVSVFNIYRHASEVMHGSYYGALMIWGLTVPGPPKTERDAFRLVFVDHQFSVLTSAIFAFAGVVECFGQYSGVLNLKVGVEEVLERLSKLPAVAEALGDQTPAR
jgi:Family of unknown function (DUF5677)